MTTAISSFTQEVKNQQIQLKPFHQALSHIDQLTLDELFSYAQRHLAPAALANRLHPFEIFIITMLIEEHVDWS